MKFLTLEEIGGVFFTIDCCENLPREKIFFANFCALENFIVPTLVVWSVVR